VRNSSIRFGKLPLVGLAILSACGGAAEPRLAARSDAAPTLAVLATPASSGAAQLRAGDLAGSRVAFEAELTSDPERLAALNDLAVSYLLEGHTDAARRLLDEVVASGATREQQAALLNLGELYAVEGYRDAAQAYLLSARSLDTGRAEPLYALALLADDRGDAQAVRATLREAVRLDDGTARTALAFAFPEERRHLEALLAEQAGARAQAEAAWRELVDGRFPVLAAAAARHLAEP
jgi:Flp pilus assembly protein TadD